MIAKLNAVRKQHKIWEFPVTEHLVETNMYCFSRGPFLIVLTNDRTVINVRSIKTLFPAGTTVCNIMDDTDCIEVDAHQHAIV